MNDLFYWAKKTPRAVLIQTPEKTISYQETLTQAQHHAETLKQRYPSGQTVLLKTSFTVECIITIMACWIAHLKPCLINPKTPEKEYTYFKNQLQAQEIECFPTHTSPTHKAPTPSPKIPLEQIISILPSSGSTGTPKLIAHTLKAHLCSANAVSQHLQLTPESVFGLCVPLFHVSGLSILLRCLITGCRLYIFDKDLMSGLAKSTHCSLVYTQAIPLLEHNASQFPNLKKLILGGSSLPTGFIKQLEEKGYSIDATYGLTETASQVLCNGKLLPHCKYKIDPNKTLWLKTESLFLAYYQNNIGYSLKNSNGYFNTGDLAKETPNGLQILGRKDRMFISGGENIYPEEIEQALLAHPNIHAAYVKTIPNAQYGQRPIALIHDNNTLTEKALKQWCKEHLTSYKCPDQFFRWPRAIKKNNGKLKMSLDEIETIFFDAIKENAIR